MSAKSLVLLVLVGFPVFGAAEACAQELEQRIERSHDYAEILYLTDQEAADNSPEGIQRYSQQLIKWLLPQADKNYTDTMSLRLAAAETLARSGKRKLISEADVALAYNRLIKKIGAPESFRASEAAIHRFRQYNLSVGALPTLLSASRNGSYCNPGEAVFLLIELAGNNGEPPPGLLDIVALRKRQHLQPTQAENVVSGGRATWMIEPLNSHADWLLSSYCTKCNRCAGRAFNPVAHTFGI